MINEDLEEKLNMLIQETIMEEKIGRRSKFIS